MPRSRSEIGRVLKEVSEEEAAVMTEKMIMTYDDLSDEQKVIYNAIGDEGVRGMWLSMLKKPAPKKEPKPKSLESNPDYFNKKVEAIEKRQNIVSVTSSALQSYWDCLEDIKNGLLKGRDVNMKTDIAPPSIEGVRLGFGTRRKRGEDPEDGEDA